MYPDEVVKKIASEYPGLISDKYKIPQAHRGNGVIKAIVLGADPTKIVGNEPIEMKYVFEIDNEKSPYWKRIQDNVNCIGLTKDNIYVENVCRNYFKFETTMNEKWEEVAKKYWIPYLRQELDIMFSKRIPVLMTTEFILWATLSDSGKRLKASKIYSECISVPKEENSLERNLFAFFRSQYYSLKLAKWEPYTNFIIKHICLV